MSGKTRINAAFPVWIPGQGVGAGNDVWIRDREFDGIESIRHFGMTFTNVFPLWSEQADLPATSIFDLEDLFHPASTLDDGGGSDNAPGESPMSLPYEARKSLGKMDLPGNYAFEVRRTEEGSLLYAQFKGDRASVPIPRRP